MASQGGFLAPKDAPKRPQVTEGGPRASPIWVRMVLLGGGVGGGAASGQWGSDGAHDFFKVFVATCAETHTGAPSKQGKHENEEGILRLPCGSQHNCFMKMSVSSKDLLG